MKKIIFFDGDGTLWYPKTTKYSQAPHWIYTHPKTQKNPNKHLVLIPKAKSTIKRLKKRDTTLIILSASPKPKKLANALLKEKVQHFNLHNLFDEVHATPPYPESKGEFIAKILKKRKIPKKHALMVGDSYLYDYNSAKKAKVDALLIKNSYNKHPNFNKVKNTISNLQDILPLI